MAAAVVKVRALGLGAAAVFFAGFLCVVTNTNPFNRSAKLTQANRTISLFNPFESARM
jgi:hypothetical protein